DAIARCIAGRSAEHRSWGDRQPEKFLAGAAVINQGDQPGATSPADSTGYPAAASTAMGPRQDLETPILCEQRRRCRFHASRACCRVTPNCVERRRLPTGALAAKPADVGYLGLFTRRHQPTPRR